MDKKKKFENPELEIIKFTNDDIITDSGDEESGFFGEPDPSKGDINGWW